VVSHEDRSIGHRIEAIQGTAKDLGIWFADALGIGYQNGVKGRLESEALQLPALHSDGSICDQPKLEATCAKGRQRLGGIREQQTGARKSRTVIVQQSLSQARRQVELRDHIGEQLLPWAIPVAIKLYEGLNVLLLVCGLEEVSKPFPLMSNKPLEASTTVKQRSVEIEDHGLNIR